jgi:hypothetical protein
MRNLCVFLAAIFLIGALIFAYIGLTTMYSYNGNYAAHIVGGDAYNYIIIGIRGAGLICTGIISVLIANGFILLSLHAKNVPAQAPKESNEDLTGIV